MCARYDQGLVLFILLHQIGTFLAAMACMSSIPTVQYVSSCPLTEADWVIAGKRKMCSSVGQNCTTPNKFVYHCLVNSYFNATLEVCAPVWKMNGYCPGFNVPAKRIQQMSERDCTKYSQKCPAQYDSSEVYKYPSCFMLNHLQLQDTTKQANEWMILSIILMAVIAVLLVTFGISRVCFPKSRTNDPSKKGKQEDIEKTVENKGKQEDIEITVQNQGKQEDIEKTVENKVVYTSCRADLGKDKDDYRADNEKRYIKSCQEKLEAIQVRQPSSEDSYNTNILFLATYAGSPAKFRQDFFAESSTPTQEEYTTKEHQDNGSSERDKLCQSVANNRQTSNQVLSYTSENSDGLICSMPSLENRPLFSNRSVRAGKNDVDRFKAMRKDKRSTLNKKSVLLVEDDDTMADSTEYTKQPKKKKPKNYRVPNNKL